jgi:hypothetical protein
MLIWWDHIHRLERTAAILVAVAASIAGGVWYYYHRKRAKLRHEGERSA